MATSVVGTDVTRVDGRLKVTGRAAYAVDHPIENLAYGVPVASTIGSGKITGIDASVAEKMPGVLAVLHHGNTEPIFRTTEPFERESHPGENRPPFEDDIVYYYGQFVALVVANTLQQAQEAARHVKVSYDAKKPLISLDDPSAETKPTRRHYTRGDAEAAFASAPVKVDATYVIPTETHNAMEMHGSIAVWKDGKFTLYETTQGVMNHQGVISQMLGVPVENVHVVSPFCGGGFGSKLFPWPQSPLAALAARTLGRPVQVTVPRSLMFTTTGHRPETEQHVRLGATQDGKLVAIAHEAKNQTSPMNDYVEGCTEPTPFLYSCPNVTAVQSLVTLNIGTPTSMRGPGTTPGMFALDSAMDELAVKLNMDPLELRLRNYAEKDESSDRPFSSKHLRECYQTGAERFGWSKRNPKVGSMRDGNEILGWGMATCTWGAYRGGAQARVRLSADGRARVSCATQDIGTGTYTVMAEIVSDKTGIPLDRVDAVLGDSSLPPGPTSGGSSATATIVPAVAQASMSVMDDLFKLAVHTEGSPFNGADSASLVMSAGRVHKKGEAPESGVPFEELLKLRRIAALEQEAKTGGAPGREKYSMHSFGAQFIEVGWDSGIARLRVRRTLTVMDAGRIINKKAGANQILGAVVMGIGMALLEETVYDPRNGKPVNNNYADYLVATNADVPEQEVIFLEHPDLAIGEYGARGIGEIGLTGVASAIAMATYHATGVRVRELPIRAEKLIG
ncbi:MAG TPA: xanthine dehydrogenase family protein molybdopterin-binding subunit [Acidobacteriaceae bacterium]|nr:xanthine dehydrogenase family protein molybdopterin-binding subunit [Acidobacteriaceae bacterium]